MLKVLLMLKRSTFRYIYFQFMFPPPTIASGDQADELKAKELQVASLERQAILDFEMHLAAATNKATITESNSLLLAQLVSIFLPRPIHSQTWFSAIPNSEIQIKFWLG